VAKRRGDDYVAAAERAARQPGKWIDVRIFPGEANARFTAWVMKQGYIRNRPRDGQRSIQVGNQTWIALPSDLDPCVTHTHDGWRLRIRSLKPRQSAR
jgi:hypothetical protein